MSSLHSRAPVWKRPEVLSLVLAVLIVIATSYFSWRNFEAFRISRSEAQTSRRIAESVGFLFTSVVEAESGQRGYLLTGKNAYLDPYLKATNSIPGELMQLRNLTAQDSRLSAQIEELSGVIHSKMEEIAETIRLKKTEGTQAALDLVLTDRGQNTMVKIRNIADGIASERFAIQQT